MKYAWRSSARVKGVSAQLAGEEIDKIREEVGGRLTPEAVIERARNKKHPLHNAFDWDDSIAAAKWRLDQAGNMIRAVVTVVDGKKDKGPVRAFVSVVQSEGEEPSYTTIGIAMSDDEMRRQVLGRALREAKQWKRRYEDYAELGEIFAAIEAAAT